MSWLSKNLWKMIDRRLQRQVDKASTSLEGKVQQLTKGLLDENQNLREQITGLQAAMRQLGEECRALRDELFNVPALPDTMFLSRPLQDRLAAAQAQAQQFLDQSPPMADHEHRYLLMQMLFRGPLEHIRMQLERLISSVVINDCCRALPILDIGCGRGEMLEAITKMGLQAIGVDTSKLMVDKLVERNLRAVHGDALEWLSSQPNNSLGGVTGFHVIEHMPLAYVESMLDATYQKIAPGGFILLETPNPFCFESLSFFHTDSTHTRPIQPFQLAFLVEAAGFCDSRAHFSAPVPAPRRQATDTWIRLYQNHGIVAYKPESKAIQRAA